RGVIQRHRVDQVGDAIFQHRSRSNRNRGGRHRVVVGDGAGRRSGRRVEADRLPVGGAPGQRDDDGLVVLIGGVGGRIDRDGAGQIARRNQDRVGGGAGVVGALGGGAADAVGHRGVKRRGVIQRHRVDQVGDAIFQHRSRSNRNRGGRHRVVVGDGAGRRSGRRVEADRLPVGGAAGQGDDDGLVVLIGGVGGG